jgi:hypothetical protein
MMRRTLSGTLTGILVLSGVAFLSSVTRGPRGEALAGDFPAFLTRHIEWLRQDPVTASGRKVLIVRMAGSRVTPQVPPSGNPVNDGVGGCVSGDGLLTLVNRAKAGTAPNEYLEGTLTPYITGGTESPLVWHGPQATARIAINVRTGNVTVTMAAISRTFELPGMYTTNSQILYVSEDSPGGFVWTLTFTRGFQPT